MGTRNVTIQFDEIGMQTKLAVQYIIDGKGYWIPLSQIKAVDLIKEEVTLPEWLVYKKKLEVYEI